NLANLLSGLSRAVSADPADGDKNDALLQQTRRELPDFINNIVLFSRDGAMIGSSGKRIPASATEHKFFRQILAGQRIALGSAFRAPSTGQMVVTVARPVEDASGRLVAVIAIGTLLEHFHDALKVQALPAGSVMRIVNENGIVLARSV